MTGAVPTTLEELVRALGESWLMGGQSPDGTALAHLRDVLKQVDEKGRDKASGDVIDERTLIQEYQKSPHKVQAFLQAMGETDTPEMLLMAWRLLRGMEVAEVDLHYQMQQEFRLRVLLKSPDGGGSEEYFSSDIDDAAMLRHFGILKMNQQPVFDGFYALQH